MAIGAPPNSEDVMPASSTTCTRSRTDRTRTQRLSVVTDSCVVCSGQYNDCILELTVLGDDGATSEGLSQMATSSPYTFHFAAEGLH
ncbi:hypothetical protein PHYPSEUDO_002663, partial [Phytophthora pseudosyringae]